MAKDSAFERFRVKFGHFIPDFLPAFEYNLPNGKRLRFDGTGTIVPFQFLKVHYDSLSNWTSMTDYRRCNPKFNGQPRYNCVLVKTETKPFFARLLYMFSYKVERKSHPFELTLPMDAPLVLRDALTRPCAFIESMQRTISERNKLAGMMSTVRERGKGAFERAYFEWKRGRNEPATTIARWRPMRA